MTTSDLVYKKSGRKYIPFGVCQTPNYITPGLWYCDIKPRMTSTTNADQYIGHLLKVGDIDTPILNQCKQYKVVQEILNNFDYNKEPYNHNYFPNSPDPVLNLGASSTFTFLIVAPLTAPNKPKPS